MTEPKISRDEFCVRFVSHMVKHAGFEKFDDGQDVKEYAEEVAPSYFEEQYPLDESPEECADADMDYWGED